MPTMKQFFVLVATLSVNAEAALLAHLKRTNNKSNTKMAVQGAVRISPSLDAGTTDALNLGEIAGRDHAFLDAPLGKKSRKAGNQRFDREAMGELFKNWEKAGGVDHAGMMNFLGSQNPADYQSNLTQILDQMDAATNTSHDAAQLYIDGVAADFDHCDPTQNGTLDQYKTAYEAGITPHNTCRDLELDYKTKWENCTDMKKKFDAVNGHPVPATTCAVDGQGGDSMEKWLDRMAQKFDTLNTTWHAKSEAYTAAQALVPGPGACNDATYTTKKSACDLLYVGIEDNACLYAFGTQSACIGYDDCYEDKASAFRNATNITIIGESERKLHWAGVQRIRCVLDALLSMDESKLTACLSAAGSDTSHLNITYPAQPAEVTCAAPTEYPCTADFNNTVFNGFPAGLAKPTCNTCTLPTPAPAGKKGVVLTAPCENAVQVSTFSELSAAHNKQCIEVTQDIDFGGSSLKNSHKNNIIFSLNGATLTGSGYQLFVNRHGGTLHFYGLTFKKTRCNVDNGGAIVLDKGATVTVELCKFIDISGAHGAAFAAWGHGTNKINVINTYFGLTGDFSCFGQTDYSKMGFATNGGRAIYAEGTPVIDCSGTDCNKGTCTKFEGYDFGGDLYNKGIDCWSWEA